MWVSINKRLVCTVYPKFFSVNMIFSAVQTLEYNKICTGFNHRGGARGPLSAPRLSSINVESLIYDVSFHSRSSKILCMLTVDCLQHYSFLYLTIMLHSLLNWLINPNLIPGALLPFVSSWDMLRTSGNKPMHSVFHLPPQPTINSCIHVTRNRSY